MNINFRNFSIPINEVIIIMYMCTMAITYGLFFWKHHKRNEMKFFEIFPLVINYFTVCIISTLIFLIGLDIVFTGYKYNEQVSEVVKELTVGLIIIILVILNFIGYVKKHRVDLIQSDREEKAERDNKIGEWVQLIVFLLMIILPICNIYKYISFIDETEKYRQIVLSSICVLTSIFLLYNLNPLEIKEKIKSLFKSR